MAGRTRDETVRTLEFLDQPGVSTTFSGQAVYADGQFKLRDNVGEFDPRSGGGLTDAQHKSLRQLVHFLSGGGPGDGFVAAPVFKQISSIFPTREAWFTSQAEADNGFVLGKKIFEVETTIAGGAATPIHPTPIKHTVFKVDGSSPAARATDNIVWTGLTPEITRTYEVF